MSSSVPSPSPEPSDFEAARKRLADIWQKVSRPLAAEEHEQRCAHLESIGQEQHIGWVRAHLRHKILTQLSKIIELPPHMRGSLALLRDFGRVPTTDPTVPTTVPTEERSQFSQELATRLLLAIMNENDIDTFIGRETLPNTEA